MMDAMEHAAYLNARVRAMKGDLFPREKLDDLLDLEDVEMLVEVLLNSPYERHIAEALAQHHGADAVETGVSNNMFETFQRLRAMTFTPQRELVDTFLRRWDLAAVKVLLRNKHHHIDSTETRWSRPGPTLSLALLRDFAQRPTLEDTLNALVFWNGDLCRGALQALPEYRATDDLAPLEEALDRSYFVGSVRRLAEHDANGRDRDQVQRVIRMEIDLINLRTLLQFRPPDGDAQALRARLLPEGTLAPGLLREMAAAPDVGHAMELMGPTQYSEVVEGLYQFLQTRRFSPIQRMLEHVLLRQVQRMARQHVLSLAVLMHYVWLKYNEVTNLRLIARGLTRHLPRGRVREGVVYA